MVLLEPRLYPTLKWVATNYIVEYRMSLKLDYGEDRGCGLTAELRATQDIEKYELVCPKLNSTSRGEIQLANCDSLDTMPCIGMATEPIPSGSLGEILLFGFILNSGWSWSEQVPLYVDSTDGQLTESPPLEVSTQQIATTFTSNWILVNCQVEDFNL